MGGVTVYSLNWGINGEMRVTVLKFISVTAATPLAAKGEVTASTLKTWTPEPPAERGKVGKGSLAATDEKRARRGRLPQRTKPD